MDRRRVWRWRDHQDCKEIISVSLASFFARPFPVAVELTPPSISQSTPSTGSRTTSSSLPTTSLFLLDPPTPNTLTSSTSSLDPRSPLPPSPAPTSSTLHQPSDSPLEQEFATGPSSRRGEGKETGWDSSEPRRRLSSESSALRLRMEVGRSSRSTRRAYLVFLSARARQRTRVYSEWAST